MHTPNEVRHYIYSEFVRWTTVALETNSNATLEFGDEWTRKASTMLARDYKLLGR